MQAWDKPRLSLDPVCGGAGDRVKPLDLFESHWPAISALLDEALSLSAPERGPWLDGLTDDRAAHRDALRALLAHQAEVETNDFLGELPSLPTTDAYPRAAVLVAGGQVGAYRLISELGQGGMGTVWLAERSDGVMRRRVALKLPRIAWDDTFTERLAREREILAALEHDHIARLYDSGVDAQGRPFIAMEYVEGEPIDAYVRARALSLRERVALLVQVMAAVSHAHSRLIVHRDLKPSNILVTRDAKVKLLDFGIAKLLEGDRTRRTALTEFSGRALTLDYASPEQIRGEPLGTASDVYAMAVVAYEVLTGERPYRLKRGSAIELEDAIASVQAPLASARSADRATARELRGDLDSALNKALKKSPSERYVTMDAFAQDVLRWTRNEPVQARPDTLAYRTTKYLARHRLQAGAGALTVLALITGTGVALWQAHEARLQAAEARIQAQRAQTEAATASAVQTFLEGVFQTNAGDQADPVRARQATARELLDRGAARIDTELAQAPAARVRLYATLSRMYADMGLYEKAILLSQRRVALAQELQGPAPLVVVDAMTALAHQLTEVDRRTEATEWLKRAESALGAVKGDTRAAQLELDVTAAQAYTSLDPAKALTLAERAANSARTLSQPAALVSALQMVGTSALRLGRNAEAQSALKEALALVEQRPELGRRFATDMYVTLAEAQTRAGERREAEASFEKAFQVIRDGAGVATSFHVAANKLAIAQYINGHYAESIATMRAPADWVRQLPGQSTVGQFPVKMLATLGRSLTMYGHPEEALAVIDEGLALLERRALIDQAPAPDIEGPQLAARVEALVELGRFAEAEQSLARTMTLIGDSPSQAGFALVARRRLWLATGRADAALDDFDRRPSTGSDPTTPLVRHAERAWIAVSAGQDDLARTEAQMALTGLEASPSREYLREAEAKASFALGLALLRRGDLDAAGAPLQRAADLRRTMFDPKRSLALADVLMVQTALKQAQHDPGGAARVRAEARAIQASHPTITARHSPATPKVGGLPAKP